MIHQSLKITGNVQGVGFRPFVYKLASNLGLKGHVANDASAVHIEIFGPLSALEQFHQSLLLEHPIHVRIDSITRKESSTEQYITPKHFEIKASLNTTQLNPTKNIPTDQRTCNACLKELFNPQDRRYHYPFINCTDCGPRYSLIKTLPYDRKATSMAKFEMCPICKTEYKSPSQRRFHAQPNACKNCGPKLSLHKANGRVIACDDEIAETARQLHAGKIVTVKGIGGFHLMCDARNVEAVKTLRSRKHRPDKPFALMALNTHSLNTFAKISDASEKLLGSSPAPIVLLPKQASCDEQLQHIAIEVSEIGCMLPYTPIHYLLFQALSRLTKPAQDNDWPDAINKRVNDTVLVVTSANLSGEPLIFDNENCLNKLANIADYFLLHDRDIIAPCDDSVVSSQSIIRRARGFSPQTIILPESGPSILACGAFLKNTFCLTQGDKAYLSPHIGELESIESCLHFRTSLERYIQILGIKPQAIACDLHPDFYSSRFAEEYSQAHNIPLIKIQHHRAHIAAVLAEHLTDNDNKNETIIGLALDGVGLGDDNTAWGGELFYGSTSKLKRIGHLSPLALPGGDIATKEIWRLGAALLSQLPDKQHYQAFAELNQSVFDNPAMEKFITQTQHPTSSSAGRWFDAIASILNIRSKVSFEGQAAMQVEQLAGFYCEQFGELPKTKQLATLSKAGMLNLYPIIPMILGANTQTAAAQFHSELIDGLLRWIIWAAKNNVSRTVVCSGGCFQNSILRDGLKNRLSLAGFKTYFPEQVPANDGGISLGQAWIASELLKQEY